MTRQAVIGSALAALAAVPSPSSRDSSDLPTDLADLQSVVSMAQSLVLSYLRAAEARNIPSSLGAAHPVPWAASVLKVSRASVRQLRALGSELASAPVISAAFAAGEVTGEQAKLMAATAAQLPTGGARVVVARGAQLGPDELRSELRSIEEELDPVGAQQRAEEAAGRALKRAEGRRRVWLSRLDGENLVYIRGYLDTVAAASFLAALDALCAPRNRSVLGVDRVADPRTAGERRHDALCEIGNRVQASGSLPSHGGDRPQANVTVSFEVLRRGVGVGLLADGTVVTAEQCRLLACDARVLPVVLSGESVPIDVGRTRRLVSGAIRRALWVRDRGCAWPGCDRALAWTEGHHCRSWAAGGATDLSNVVLVCGWHHRQLHHSGWRVSISPADGLPDFFAPGDDRPRRNHYHPRL